VTIESRCPRETPADLRPPTDPGISR